MDSTTSKAELYQAREQYRQEIESQVKDLRAKTEQIGKTVLVVGGVFAGAYLLYSLFFGGSKKKKKKVVSIDNELVPVKVKEEDKEDSWIVSSIKTYIVSFLIAIAREKLSEALLFLKESEEEK